MSNNYSQYCLKVLKGVNEGAVADFDSDLITVGSSADCDVILSGLTEERIFELYINNDDFFVKVLNKPLNIDGIEIPPTEQLTPLEEYQLISFDDCCVAVGEKNAEWPTNIFNLKHVNEQSSKKSILPQLLYKTKYFFTQVMTDTQKILATFLVFILVGGLFLFNTNAPKTSSFTPQAIADIPLPIKENATQVITTKSSEIKADKLKNAEQMAYGLLQTFGVNRINLSLQKDGVLIASGYVGSNEKWEKAKTSILEDVSLVKEINTEGIETFKQRVVYLNNMLRDNNLDKVLTVKADPNKKQITVSGEVTKNTVKKWDIIKNQYSNNFGNELKIKSNIIDIENNLKLLIRGVSIGKTRYFTSTLGKKYMVGSDLGDGFRVLKIEVDKITLSYKGNEVPFYYNKGI